jgi:D-ribose pyranose/furanose isomerase RbsD|tara:strand:+ start:33 stop:413 length:381 start_codon:yes stop_codon:yes gene_type:complete
MIKLKDLITERADIQYIASELVKNYGLKSKVKFGTGDQYADYVPESDTIKLRKNYSSVKQFLITVLHEIRHALDAQKLGHKKFKKKYDQAGTVAAHGGLDPYANNKWEKRAENWAKREVKKWIDKF